MELANWGLPWVQLYFCGSSVLRESGFTPFVPKGAYYVMADISGFNRGTDLEFCRYLVEKVGVAAVPGSSFFVQRSAGNNFVRFCFCKKYETLEAAKQKLRVLAAS